MCADYRCAVGCECACTGDCDRNGIVGIEEIITAVGMALNGTAFPTGCLAALCACRPGSFCRNSGVTVECLVRAVGHALGGCPGEAAPPTVTPSPIATPTIPAALPAAVAAVCGAGPGESREVTAADGAYTITCDRFEHALGAVVRPFADTTLATAALDDLRDRGAAVAFHDLDAVAWSARAPSDPAFRQNHVWVAGCWFVWAYSVDVGLTLLNPVALSEAIYSAGVADGLFVTCASAPTPTATPIVAGQPNLDRSTAGPAPGQQVVFRPAVADGSVDSLRGSLPMSSCGAPNSALAAGRHSSMPGVTVGGGDGAGQKPAGVGGMLQTALSWGMTCRGRSHVASSGKQVARGAPASA